MNRARIGRQGRCRTTAAVVVVTALALAGCGGGGGSSAPAPADLSAAPGAAALNAYYQASHQSNLNASVSGNTLSLILSFTPNAGTTTFEGSTVESATEALSLSENGLPLYSDTQTVFYAVNPFVPFGSALSNNTEYEVIQSYTPVPATITVGQTGPLTTSTIYHNSTKAITDGTQTTTFAVYADTPTTVRFCTTAVISASPGNPDNLTSGTETDCYRVDASGNTTLFSITVSVSGTAVTFQ